MEYNSMNQYNAYNLILQWHKKFHGTAETTQKNILIDGKNIFTYCFQPIQRLQSNFTTDGIRNFMKQQKQRKKTF